MSVYKRSGRWYVDIPACQSGTGRRERKAIPEARNRTQAERAEVKIRDEIFEGTYGRRAAPLFAKFVGDVYLPWAQQNKRSAVHDTYRAKTLCDFFKGKTLTEVSPLLIEKYKRWRAECATRTGGTVQPGTINNELALLSRVFSMAVDNGLLSQNPCSRVRRLRVDNNRERPLERDEQPGVLEQLESQNLAGGHARSAVELAIGTGMRRGEVCNLVWARVDFERGRIKVTNTKTGRDRYVPMSEDVRALLQRLWAARSQDVFVFPSPRKPSQPITGDSIHNALKEACAAAKVEGLRFHDLRHTAATRMAEGGGNLVDIKDVLGHSNIQMTARYAHATRDGMRRAVEAAAHEPGHNLVTSEKFRAAGGGGK